LEYHRNKAQAGELWRFISASLLHTNLNHLLMNLAGLALAWALHGEYYRPIAFIVLMAALSLAVGIGVHLFSPHLFTYVGLSGALNGLIVWGAVRDIHTGLRSGWLLLAIMLIKIIHEQLSPPNLELQQLINANVAVDAHLYGVIAALILGLLSRYNLLLIKNSDANTTKEG
jgi:rhomboid family GlyGly-CTERM serine protease